MYICVYYIIYKQTIYTTNIYIYIPTVQVQYMFA